MAKINGKKIKNMCLYGAADAMGGGVGQVISIYYLVFLTIVMKLDPWQASLAIAVGKVWDGISDPMMGVIVDRTRSKFGSCRSWLLWSALPFLISYIMLWYCFGIEGQIGRTIYFAFAYVLYSTTYTMAMVPYESLLPRIVDDYRERTDYASSRMIFSGLGCVLTFFLYDIIIAIPEGGELNSSYMSNYAILGIVFGIFFTIPLLITFFGTKERPRTDVVEKLSIKEVFTNYGQILRCNHYKKYFTLCLLGALVSACVTSTLSYFAIVAYPEREGFSALGILFTFTFLTGTVKGTLEIGFFPINVILMKKHNKQRPYLIDLPLIILASVAMLFIGKNSGFGFFVVAIMAVGAGVSCLGFVPMNLLPDLSDVDELIYGKRREGENAGLTTMGKKIVSGLTIALFGLILSAFGVEGGQTASNIAEGALTALKIIFCVIPFFSCIAMFLISKSYKIDEKSHKLMKRLIAQKHQSGIAIASAEEVALIESITGIKSKELWVFQNNTPDALSQPISDNAEAV